jgi:hypothetical protein
VTSAVNVFSTISLDELMQGLSISGYLFRKEDIVNIFNYVDVDKSGALDFAEVKQLICSVIRCHLKCIVFTVFHAHISVDRKKLKCDCLFLSDP